MNQSIRLLMLVLILLLTACTTMYLEGLEKVGIPKRDVMVYRVEKARDTQQETKEQFKSALEQFTAATHFQGGDLEATYKRLNDAYEASLGKAEEVRSRIADIESVSEALFTEWKQEITQYSNASMRQNSQRKLEATQAHYHQLISSMKQAESKIQPILTVFNDQVMYLKHNLNARAIASLKGELGNIKSDVSALIASMERSINEANAFINTMDSK
ncbi:MAG: DNA repair protein [Proteobacteria bacterium SG_bin4]|nr:MAG: DNA repair protein [Proteobacteria bacterium SG_bin4]